MTSSNTADKIATGDAVGEPPASLSAPVTVLTIDIGGTITDTSGASLAVGNQSPGTAVAETSPDKQTAANATEAAASAPAATDASVAKAAIGESSAAKSPPSSILVVDLGGTKVKILAMGQTEPRKAPSGKDFTPARLVERVQELAQGWDYEALSIGYPGLVGSQGPRSEPGNLGPGWVGFDFAAAFGKPVKMVNDASMQALGSYEGGRMLFLGLGTGLGSALIAGHVIISLELGQMRYDGDKTLGQVLGRQGLKMLGKAKWRSAVHQSVTALMHAFVVDYVVIGGGNSKNVKELPPGARRGHNLTAFRGGFRLWSVEDIWVLAAAGGESPQPTVQEALRML